MYVNMDASHLKNCSQNTGEQERSDNYCLVYQKGYILSEVEGKNVRT